MRELGPMEWLCAAFSMANRRGVKGYEEDGAFKITKMDGDTMDVLHKETGVVWQFTAKILRNSI